VLFYVVALAISWPAMILWDLPDGFRVGDVVAARQAYGRIGLFFGFGPMLAALLVAYATGKGSGLRDLASRLTAFRVAPAWYAAALITPIIPQWIGVIVWSRVTDATVVYPTFSEWSTRWLQLALLHGFFAVGEELGWRGFMLPRVLTGRAWASTSVIVGCAWAAWHYPLWAAANYAITGSIRDTVLILVLASVLNIALSIVVTWIFTRTHGSVLPAMLFHGSVNANMNLIYEGLDEQAPGRLDLLASTTVATVVLAAFVFTLTRRIAELTQIKSRSRSLS
jgi:uncharacterized protein